MYILFTHVTKSYPNSVRLFICCTASLPCAAAQLSATTAVPVAALGRPALPALAGCVLAALNKQLSSDA